MVKDHSDSERGNPLQPHRQQELFYLQHPPIQDSKYHGLCYTSRGALAGANACKQASPTALNITQLKNSENNLYYFTFAHYFKFFNNF